MEKVKILSKILMLLVYIIRLEVCNGNTSDTQPRIVIVGAGAAGIAAASKLFDNGFRNVIILEAENRTGGRIHTTQLGNYLVDLGAQWVHGEIGNVVFKLANPLGLLDKKEESNIFIEQTIIDSSGDVLNDEIVNNLTDFYVKYMEEHNLSKDSNYESIGQYMRQMFHEEFKNTPQILNRHNDYLHLLELFVTSNDPAESWNQLSAAGIEEYVVCPGIQHINWKTRGYSTILDVLMKRYPNPAEGLPVLNNTFLNAEVVSINYMKNSKKYPILVTTSKGQEYEADHVLVTVSLGVLKEKHTSLFTPPLSNSKVRAIEGLALGNAAKVYLHFEKPFWQVEFEVQNLFSFVWNDADRELIENVTFQMFIPLHLCKKKFQLLGKIGELFAQGFVENVFFTDDIGCVFTNIISFLRFFIKTFKQSERMWLLGIMGAFTVEYKPNLLELWISAKYAKAMEELPEQKVFNHAIEVLYKFMGKNFNVTKPVAMLRTQWISNPHFRGTYSYRSVETQKKQVYPDMLEEPLQNLEILFAGEATSQHRFSTVDGAIASGWKSANRILNFYKS